MTNAERWNEKEARKDMKAEAAQAVRDAAWSTGWFSDALLATPEDGYLVLSRELVVEIDYALARDAARRAGNWPDPAAARLQRAWDEFLALCPDAVVAARGSMAHRPHGYAPMIGDVMQRCAFCIGFRTAPMHDEALSARRSVRS